MVSDPRGRSPRVPPGRTLFTIGHSTHSSDEFVAILRSFSVTHLIDIRSIPRSRTNPQFNGDRLPGALRAAGIAYTHLTALGGRRAKSKLVEPSCNAAWRVAAFHNYADYAQTEPFQAALRQLLELASRETCAIMCAEAVWWRCHRRIVTDHVLAHGVSVSHLFSLTKSEQASLTPFAVVARNGRVSYPSATG